MRSLGLQVAASMVAALVVSGALVTALLPLAERGRRGEIAREWTSYGLELARAELAPLSDAERRFALQRMRASFRFPLELESPQEVRQRMGGDLPTEPQISGSPPEYLILPLDSTGAALVVGPTKLAPSETARRALPPILGLLVAVLGAVFVAVPLTRRLRRLEATTRQLASGELSARAAVQGRDVVADLATSFNAMAARIETLFVQREQMLQALAHEISTPLARMRFQLEAIDSASDEASRSTRLAALDRELVLLDELSVELAGWIQAEGGRSRRTEVDLAVALAEIAEHEAIGHPTPRIELSVPRDVSLVVSADARQLYRAIENVVRNAQRHARERVVLRARPVAAGVEVEVADDGPGIPVADRLRVLEPFARVEQSRSRAHGGMGLGLAIAQRVSSAHGGSIRIDAAPEGGAQVVFFWPSGGSSSHALGVSNGPRR